MTILSRLMPFSTAAIVVIIIAVCCVTTSHAIPRLPNVLVHVFKPGDLVGTYDIQKQSSTESCPKVIKHDGYEQTRNKNVFKVPHGQITQDGDKCDDYSYMTVIKDVAVLKMGLIGDEEAQARDNVKRFIRNTTVIVEGIKKLSNVGVESWAVLEFQNRVCVNTTRFNVGTVGLVVEENEQDLVIDGVGTKLEKGSKYMVLLDNATKRSCVYKGQGAKISDDQLPKPLNSAPPAPATTTSAGDTDASSLPSDDATTSSSPGDTTSAGVGEPGASGSPGTDDESDSEGAECFPAHATVELDNGVFKRMEQLELGDRVRVGPNEFSPVFMFTHKLNGGQYEFLRIDTAAQASIRASKGHYLYVDGHLAPASSIVVGSSLRLASGQSTLVTGVSRETHRGLYNPQTMHGDIVVNGIQASTYTTAVEPSTAHALLAPFRTMYNVLGVTTSVLEKGGGFLTHLLPRGRAAPL